MERPLVTFRSRGKDAYGTDEALASARIAERVAIGGIVALALLVRLAYGPQIRDDAYITLRYAQHLASGLGFTYNAGERVLGTTTPLFAILLAALARIGVEPHVSAVVVGVAADLGVVFLLWRFGRTTVGPAIALLASLVYSLLTPTVAHAVSGMETALYLLLILLAFHLAHTRRTFLCAGACGLVVLLRPDGLLVVVTLVVWSGWETLRNGGWPRPAGDWARRVTTIAGRIWLPALGFAALVLPWAIAAWLYFGSPVPHSMVAKWELPGVGRLASVRYSAAYFLDLDERWFLPLTMLALIGFAADLRRRRPLYPFLGWTGAYSTAFLASNKFVYPLMPFEWYFLPLLLPYSLAIAAGWRCVVEWIAKWRRYDARAQRRLSGALALAFVTLSLAHVGQERAALDRIVGDREALYFRLAQRMARYGVSADVVAAPEIGAFGYAYPGPLLDLNALVTPSAVGHTFGDILRADRPPWLVSYETILPTELLQSAWFQQHYRPVTVLQNWESRRLVLYRWYPEPGPTRSTGPVLGDVFELVGRRLRWEETRSGRFLRVELTWRAREAPAKRTTFSVQVLDDQGAKLAQQDNEPQEGSRPTTSWRAGELVVDRYDLAFPEIEGRSATWLAIIGYESENPREELHWQSAGGTSVGARVYAPLTLATDAPTRGTSLVSCDAAFFGGIRVTGAGFRSDSGGYVLTLSWEASAAMNDDYTVFVHVLDASGRLIAQADGPLAGGKLLTSILEPGDRVVETRSLSWSPGGPAARVLIGLYLPPDGRRLPRADALGDSVVVAVGPSARCE